jgi:hypothetical protein
MTYSYMVPEIRGEGEIVGTFESSWDSSGGGTLLSKLPKTTTLITMAGRVAGR